MNRPPSRPAMRLIGAAGAGSALGLVAPDADAQAIPNEIRSVFRLVGQDGKEVSDRDLHGKPSLVLFG